MRVWSIAVGIYDRLRKKGFCLHHQPIVNADTCLTVGYEGLIRKFGTQSLGANKIVDLARKHNKLAILDQFAAIETKQILDSELCKAEPLWFSFNASVLSLSDELYVESLCNIFNDVTQSVNVVIEVVETETLEHADYYQVADNLRRLKALGINIALDDWGDGFGSLKMLRLFPVDLLKFDKSVISDLMVQNETVSKNARRVIQAKMQMARTLDKAVVIEGIETPAHETVAKSFQPDFLQGYLYGRPKLIDSQYQHKRVGNS